MNWDVTCVNQRIFFSVSAETHSSLGISNHAPGICDKQVGRISSDVVPTLRLHCVDERLQSILVGLDIALVQVGLGGVRLVEQAVTDARILDLAFPIEAIYAGLQALDCGCH